MAALHGCRTPLLQPRSPKLVGIISVLGRICNSARSLATFVRLHTAFASLTPQPAPFFISWSSASDRMLKVLTPSILRKGPHWIRTERLAM